MRPRAALLRYASALAFVALSPGCYGKNSQREFIQNPSGPSGPPSVGIPFLPAPAGIRVLLSWQYRNAVTSLLGAAAGAAVTPPPDTTLSGFTAIGAAQLELGDTAVAAYEQSAQAAAAAALADPAAKAALIPCTPANPTDAACMRTVVSAFARRAFRRALAPDELAAWIGIGTQAAAAYSDFNKGVQFAVAGILQAPSFLYLVELGAADAAQPGRLQFTGDEMASRMSFFLAGTTPSTQLLDAAESGALSTPDGVRTASRLLLQEPTAQDALHHFFDEWLELDGLAAISKDPATFPRFTPQLAAAMQTETEALVDDLVWKNPSDVRSLFDAPYTFINADLAAVYGMPAPATAFAKVALPDSSLRGGILGQASFLALMAHPVTTSPTRRGKFVREHLLCQPIGAPPSNVVTVIPPSPPGHPETMRDKLMIHQTDPACSGCHVLMDDVGLGLENFDALGQFQTTEEGLTVNATMTVSDLGTFTGARQLGALIKADSRSTRCLARSVFRAATGHVETAGELTPLLSLDDAFQSSGYDLQSLLVELTASDAFRYASAPGGAP